MTKNPQNVPNYNFWVSLHRKYDIILLQLINIFLTFKNLLTVVLLKRDNKSKQAYHDNDMLENQIKSNLYFRQLKDVEYEADVICFLRSDQYLFITCISLRVTGSLSILKLYGFL